MEKENIKLTFLKSNKNQLLLSFNGYLYQCNKEKGNTKYWYCIYKSCNRSIHTIATDVYIKGGTETHDHEPNPDTIAARIVRNKMKERIAQENIPVSMIYEQDVSNSSIDSTTIAILPTCQELGIFLKLECIVVFP